MLEICFEIGMRLRWIKIYLWGKIREEETNTFEGVSVNACKEATFLDIMDAKSTFVLHLFDLDLYTCTFLGIVPSKS